MGYTCTKSIGISDLNLNVMICPIPGEVQADKHARDLHHITVRADYDQSMERLQAHPHYRNKTVIATLRTDINELEKFATSFFISVDSGSAQSASSTPPIKVERESRQCPVCFEEPKEVFSCPVCDGLICGRCVKILTSCPLCRGPFQTGKGAPKRNKLAERLLRQDAAATAPAAVTSSTSLGLEASPPSKAQVNKTNSTSMVKGKTTLVTDFL